MEQVPTSEDAGSITSEVLAEFLSESTDRVEVIFTKFVSLVSCNPTIQTLLPLDPQGIADSEDEIFRLTTKDSQLIIEKDLGWIWEGIFGRLFWISFTFFLKTPIL